jgi:hypothetical protein
VEVQQTLGGRYKLLNELGSGGMAVVWRARDEVLGRPVAVKLLAGRFAGDPQSRARIRDEARAAATLSHPNIAQVYDYGESREAGGTLPYVVMELINGPTLQQRVASGPLPPRTVFRICGEVAAALAAAHADGLVHRDIKMANIMVTAAGAKVVDFGIATAAGPVADEEMVVGTPAYLAPERLTGEDVQPASDVYALGVLLYRLLAHESPWSAESTTQMLSAHIYLEPAPLPPMPGVPPAVADLVARCLRKDPADRPTAAEVSATLGDAAEAAGAVREADPVPATLVSSSAEAALDEPTSVAGDRRVSADATGTADPSEGAHGAASVGSSPAQRPGGSGEDPPVAAGRAGAVGGGPNPVRPGRRKALLAGGGIAAALIAALVAWSLMPDPSGAARTGDAVGTMPAAPAHTGAGEVRVTGAAPAPAATELGGREPIAAGSAPAASVTPAGSPAAPSAGVTGTTPAPSGSAPVSTSASPLPEGARLSSPGGVVHARCAKGKATLTGWEPAPDFTVERVNPGPALTTEIVFKGSKDRYRMTVTCVAGTPTPVVLPL